MMPPTSIDGTDITGATIDGTDVQEITVDGQTVFTAGPSLQDIVAPGDLKAWYPFTNNANDETRTGGLLDNAGITVSDSTDYSATSIDNPTVVSSGGVTDLDAGKNSAAYDFDGSDDHIDIPLTQSDMAQSGTVMGWVNYDSLQGEQNQLTPGDDILSVSKQECAIGNIGGRFHGNVFDGAHNISDSGVSISLNTWFHVAMGFSTSSIKIYVDGDLENTISGTVPRNSGSDFAIGRADNDSNYTDGTIDDVRFYEAQLTDSQINQIYENTKPN